ncbi:MAG: MarR family transcriptional regulator [Gammaproteobacteria bacterium]|nr:MarR family transcriptional regulator [Gammaproteobacteria bacterium]
MDEFLRQADQMVIYKLRTSWLQISKMYNEMAAEHDATMSMAFVLLAIDEEDGTPVTRIAPRMGMEPNSLSRILKSMEDKGFIYRQKDDSDKRMAFVLLTELGKEKRIMALKAVFRLERAIIKDMDVEMLKSFFKVTDSIPEAIDQFKDKMASYLA